MTNPILLRPSSDGKQVGQGIYEISNRVNISKEYDDMSLKAANIVADTIRTFIPTQEKPYINIGLSTGSGSRGMYDKLVAMSQEGNLDFSHVNFFNLDEYIGLSPEDPRSYHHEMHTNFFDRIPEGKRPHSVHLPDGMLAVTEPKRACDEYENAIAQAGGISLQVLGIGENSHIGFSEPNADPSMKAPTSIFNLTDSTLHANARNFANDIDKMPKQAISMGLGTIMKAQKIILLANGPLEGQGKKKIHALVDAGYGPVVPSVPASILQRHDDTTYFLTEESAQALGFNWKHFWQDQAKAGVGNTPVSR